MENNICIVGENHDKELLESIVIQLINKGYEVSSFLYNQIQQNWEKLINVDKLIIVLSPDSNIDFYNLSLGRLLSKKRSINLFLQPTAINAEQKKKIGRNKTIFKSLFDDDEHLIKELVSVIQLNKTWEPLVDLIEVSVLTPNNQYDEDGNLILPVYDEPKKSKSGIIIGLIVAACIMGFGIWGYSAYVESAQKEAEENLWNAWDEYLNTEAGSMLATVGETLRNESLSEFRQYGFEKFIDGKIEPSKDVSWFDMGPAMEGITLTYTPPVDIKSLMTDNLLQAYNEIENTTYNETFWNPVIALERSGYFTINHIKISEDGKSGIITYVPFSYLDSQSIADMSFRFENGEWKIDNFINIQGDYFTSLISEYINEQEKNEEILYIGNVYTPSGLFPISLQINYKNHPELTALYENISQNVKFEMTGEFQDDNIGFYAKINENEEIGFDLKMEGDNILSGKLILYSKDKENIYYDVLLKEEGKEGV